MVFRGATQFIKLREPILFIDISGGSTEIILGDQHGIIDCLSLPYGCHNSRQAWLGNALASQDLNGVQKKLTNLLPKEWRQHTLPKCAYGTSGIIRSLLQKLEYHGQATIIKAQFRAEILARLQGCAIDAPQVTGVDRNRQASFVAGLLILHALSLLLGFEEVLPSAGGLREGLLAHVIHTPSQPIQA